MGGFLGAGVMQAMRFGVARGLFSNESGLGSAPIVAAAAQTKNPVRQALVSATGTAAACWGKQGVIGTIAKGAQADLLVLAKNPLDDITNTRALDAIYIGGRRLDPPAR